MIYELLLSTPVLISLAGTVAAIILIHQGLKAEKLSSAHDEGSATPIKSDETTSRASEAITPPTPDRTMAPEQGRRMSRHILAVGASFMVIALICLLYWQDRLERPGFIHGVSAILILCVMFYMTIRSGLNLKMNDPSLTTHQMASSILTMTYVMFYAKSEVRGVLMLIFPVVFLFGVLRLTTRELIGMALFASVCYGVLIGLLVRLRPDALDLSLDLLHWLVMSLVLACFALVGGHIGELRKQLHVTNAKLSGAL